MQPNALPCSSEPDASVLGYHSNSFQFQSRLTCTPRRFRQYERKPHETSGPKCFPAKLPLLSSVVSLVKVSPFPRYAWLRGSLFQPATSVRGAAEKVIMGGDLKKHILTRLPATKAPRTVYLSTRYEIGRGSVVYPRPLAPESSHTQSTLTQPIC